MQFKIKNKKILNFALSLCVLIFLFCVSGEANAASLYFSPSSGSYTVGQTLSASVYVSSSDQAMNAASGVISFPGDKLEVVSVSQSGSIINLWVQEPSFSNSAGTVNFEGIVLNPGYAGASGKIITVNFRAKSIGTAPLNFSTGSVLANDGQGTNILSNLATASFAIASAVTGSGADQSTTPALTAGAPQAPLVTSSTHPDSKQWYSGTTAEFSWNVPDGINGARLLLDKKPASIPTVLYSKPISSKTVKDLDDGIWYFHVQLKNEFGWGSVSHYKIQIDTKNPGQFSIKFLDGKKSTDPTPAVYFDAEDALSGIDHYKIKTNGGEFLETRAGSSPSEPYTIPLQDPGTHTILVYAVDKAGNHSVSSEEFEVIPIDAPEILEYPQELKSGSALIIKGSTYPNALATVFLEDEDGKIASQSIKSGADGLFSLVWEQRMDSGIYKFWAVAENEEGAKSRPTEKFVISSEGGVLGFAPLIISYLILIFLAVSIVFLVLFAAWYMWKRVSTIRKKFDIEARGMDSAIGKAFDLLRDDLKEHIKLLKKAKSKRRLTKEEERILKDFSRHFDDAEEYLKDELSEMRRKIKVKKG